MRNLLILSLLSCFLTAGSAGAAPAQAQTHAQDPQFGREREKDATEEKMEHQREKAMNKQRQVALQKDTDRLLELATQLKEYVDKSSEHTLSLDVVKKAEEIEKLAKSVKEKMKGNY